VPYCGEQCLSGIGYSSWNKFLKADNVGDDDATELGRTAE